MNDIKDRTDIIRLVDGFYDKVKADLLLAPVFSHLDWPKHMLTMYNSWSSMLLGDNSYQGNPFQKHVNLAINAMHFMSDIELTKKLKEACKFLEIQLLDHVIVTTEGYFSFADEGLI